MGGLDSNGVANPTHKECIRHTRPRWLFSCFESRSSEMVPVAHLFYMMHINDILYYDITSTE